MLIYDHSQRILPCEALQHEYFADVRKNLKLEHIVENYSNMGKGQSINYNNNVFADQQEDIK